MNSKETNATERGRRKFLKDGAALAGLVMGDAVGEWSDTRVRSLPVE